MISFHGKFLATHKTFCIAKTQGNVFLKSSINDLYTVPIYL